MATHEEKGTTYTAARGLRALPHTIKMGIAPEPALPEPPPGGNRLLRQHPPSTPLVPP